MKGMQEFLWEYEQRINMVKNAILGTLWKMGRRDHRLD